MKNANIQTIEECYRRLLDGEVFYFEDNIIMFVKNTGIVIKNENKFTDYIYPSWLTQNYKKFEIKSNWYENIKKPIPCWVGDTEEELKSHEKIALIILYHADQNYKFEAEDDIYKLAKPILVKELEEYYANG